MVTRPGSCVRARRHCSTLATSRLPFRRLRLFPVPSPDWDSVALADPLWSGFVPSGGYQKFPGISRSFAVVRVQN
jgi:hypothetical protein